MFMPNANMAFNHDDISCRIIRRMKKEATEMHSQMRRLYQAAKDLKQIQVKAELARTLGVSDQVVNNWEARGISDAGLLEAQAKIGCDAVWLREGVGDMIRGQPVMPDLTDLAELVVLFGRMDEADREAMLRFARSQATSNVRAELSAKNKS